MKEAKIAVKYCGGCNPYYDRKQAAVTIEAKLNIKLEPYSEDRIPDVTLIICGCKSECIDISKYKSRCKTVVINDEKSIDEVIKIINETVHKKTCVEY